MYILMDKYLVYGCIQNLWHLKHVGAHIIPFFNVSLFLWAHVYVYGNIFIIKYSIIIIMNLTQQIEDFGPHTVNIMAKEICGHLYQAAVL